LAAAAAEGDPTEEGQVFPPGEGVIAVAAVGAGRDDAFALGEAGDEHVEEAAEGQTQEGGEDCAEGLDFGGDGI